MVNRTREEIGKDAWLSWIDDLPLPDTFQDAQDGLQEYISELTRQLNAAEAMLTGPLSHAAIVAQKDREIIAATARADAAAGQMRERCAAFCKENEVGLSARDGYVISARHELSGGTHPGMKYSEALSALPLQEPTP